VLMKTLYLIRHAKSSWNFPDLADDQRPLLEKGKKRAKKVVDYLLDKDIKVDYIISSHAVRALETAKIIAHALHYPLNEIKVEHLIYHANPDKLFDQFYDIPEKCESLMLVGHNPTFTSFANCFLDDKIDWLPTSGVVSISFDTDRWEDVVNVKCKTNFVVYPKNI